MLGKLIKYDLKSMSRAFIPVWFLAPLIALLLSFSVKGTLAWASGSPLTSMFALGNGMLVMVMGILFFAALAALFVMTIVFVIQRFWNGLLKEEGYLMFTLPVHTWELIVSKAVTATIVSFVSILIGIFSGMILMVFSTEEVIRSWFVAWKYLFSGIFELGPTFWLNVMLFILLIILGIVQSIYHIYTDMAIGHLFPTHKVVGSCVSYIGISIIVSIVSNIVNACLSTLMPDTWYNYRSYDLMELMGTAYLLYLMLGTIVELAAYHVITERILSTKLNLE